MSYERSMVSILRQRIHESHKFIQIVIGPRQTGKTTAVHQALANYTHPFLFSEATKGESDANWLRAQWYQARNLLDATNPTALLVIDEIQYIKNWSSVVKTLWDEDARSGADLRVVLTGSSSTLIQEGLEESLQGRFELIHSTHWSFKECAQAFEYSLNDFLFFGGYPATAALRDDLSRWSRYMTQSIISPSVNNDVLSLGEIRRPELIRRLFELGASFSGQELSYRKILGQLNDSGNTATIAHYLHLLASAGLMSGLQKYDAKLLREKSSSPRLMVHNTGLMTASAGRRKKMYLDNPDMRGRLVESAVGAYLINRSIEENFDVYWWRDGSDEVDFVIARNDELSAIEVKSGRVKSTSGLTRFQVENPHAHCFVVGSPQCSLEQFLLGEIALF